MIKEQKGDGLEVEEGDGKGLYEEREWVSRITDLVRGIPHS